MKKYIIGVDVGGTNIKLGLIQHQGRIVARSRLSTRGFSQDKKELIRGIVQAVKGLLSQNGVKLSQLFGVGIGMPGPVNAQDGIVKYLPNIPGWRNVRLARLVRDKLGVPVFIDNDVNLITLGEWRYGAGKGYGNLVCMTLGTGVGGGLILDNRLYRGEGYVAGEIGYMLLKDDAAGRYFKDGNAYFEHYVGNRHLLKKAAKVFGKPDIQLEDIHALAGRGNSKAIRFWDQMGVQIGNTLVGIINLLNPRLIIIGGGVSNNFRFLAPAVRRIVQERAMKAHRGMVKIVRTKLGDDAGILGAKILVEENRGKLT